MKKLSMLIGLALALPMSAQALTITKLDTYIPTPDTDCPYNVEDEGYIECSEISTFDADSSKVFITNSAGNKLHIVDVEPTGAMDEFKVIDLSVYGGGPNSVAVKNGLVAVAVEADTKQDNGTVELFDTDGNHLDSIVAGALPDMLTFTPNGDYLLVANEGEPNKAYTVDPEGSVSIIDTATFEVKTATFNAFDEAGVEGVRIFGPGASFSQDVEPEYITVSNNSKTAWIALQENNAIAKLDIKSATITDVYPLGYKDHSLPENAFDASNKDDAINITTHPTLGMYQPDAIASFKYKKDTFIITANEGDARDYDGYSEEFRVKDDEIVLDETAYPNAADLKESEDLGRLKTTLATGDTDGDGDIDQIYSYGARSFSIWNANGELVFDSGSFIEDTLAAAETNGVDGDIWNDGRSDDKGPEPESVTVGKFKGKTLAFVGMERTSDIFVFDISNPYAPKYVQFIDIDNEFGDISPEGLTYIKRDNGTAWLLVSNEVSSTTSIYEITK